MGITFSFDDAYLLAQFAEPGTPLAQALNPEAMWTRTDYMLQSIEYSLRWLAWTKTEDAQKRRNKPKPIPTPAEQAKPKELEGMSKSELRALLSAKRSPVETVVHGGSDKTEKE